MPGSRPREHLRLAVVIGALDDRLVDAIARGLHVLTEELANRSRRAMSPARRIDDERRALHAVTAAEELRHAGVAAAIRREQTALRHGDELVRALHDLTGGEDHVVGRDRPTSGTFSCSFTDEKMSLPLSGSNSRSLSGANETAFTLPLSSP